MFCRLFAGQRGNGGSVRSYRDRTGAQNNGPDAGPLSPKSCASTSSATVA